MSQSYAARLSEYKNKGVCGLPENQESHRVTNIKIKKLAKLLVEAKNVVIITGAGISTGAGIPDFRGPKGVWTQERERKKQEALKKKEEAKKKKHVKRKISKSNDFSASKRSKVDDMSDVITGAAAAAAAVAAAAAAVANLCNDASTSESSTSCTPTKTANTDDEESSDDGKQQPPQSSGPRRQSPRLASKTSQATVLENFADARPTLCHRAITKLVRERRVHYCITQNVDGLHRRSGLSRNHHASVHGCVCTEKCESCGAEFFHDFDVGGMSFAPTGRKCQLCHDGILRDTLLDWEDGLPEDDFERCHDELERPGTFCLCLGTSLRIIPVGELPLLAAKFAICNLQATPMDDQASLVIRSPVDHVMSELMKTLGYQGWEKESAPEIERVWKPLNFTKGSWPPKRQGDEHDSTTDDEDVEAMKQAAIPNQQGVTDDIEVSDQLSAADGNVKQSTELQNEIEGVANVRAVQQIENELQNDSEGAAGDVGIVNTKAKIPQLDDVTCRGIEAVPEAPLLGFNNDVFITKRKAEQASEVSTAIAASNEQQQGDEASPSSEVKSRDPNVGIDSDAEATRGTSARNEQRDKASVLSEADSEDQTLGITRDDEAFFSDRKAGTKSDYDDKESENEDVVLQVWEVIEIADDSDEENSKNAANAQKQATKENNTDDETIDMRPPNEASLPHPQPTEKNSDKKVAKDESEAREIPSQALITA